MAIFTLYIWTIAPELLYDNCRVNIGHEHEPAKNLRIL